MNIHQLNWAREHDWFFNSRCIGLDDSGFAAYEITVVDCSTGRMRVFADLHELRAWAGY